MSWEDAKENITQLFDQVVANRDIIVINRAEGESVVLIAIEELNHLIATAHLENEKQTIGTQNY
nr:type II toxin-antitoxin system Phd/YefM family antitoxin [Planktothrix paucivesiculata]